MSTPTDISNPKQLDTEARRLARKLDWRVRKSRTREHFHSNDHGGYMIIDNWTNTVRYGVDYDLNVQDVIDICRVNLANQ